MTAARYDLIIDQGADFSLELTVKESSTAKDLTGWFARAQLRKNKSSSSIAASFSASITSASAGKLTMSLPYSVSDDMTAGLYHYDLEIYQAASAAATATQVSRLINGTANIRREVTR